MKAKQLQDLKKFEKRFDQVLWETGTKSVVHLAIQTLIFLLFLFAFYYSRYVVGIVLMIILYRNRRPKLDYTKILSQFQLRFQNGIQFDPSVDISTQKQWQEYRVKQQ
jgi:hypothetical protein